MIENATEEGAAGVLLARSFGREAFGLTPENYHLARPPYPDMVWDALVARAGLSAGISILEIGAGTGLATKRLLAENPKRLLAIEPDPRLADFLRSYLADKRLQVELATFEDIDLATGAFDLAVCATAFHWLDAPIALRRIHRALRPEGSVALFWNVFGDASRPDPFHEATTHLFAGGPRSPSGGGTTALPYALDTGARQAELVEAGFLPDAPELLRWTLTLDPVGLRRLYSTYSNVTALLPDDRERLLDGLIEIAERQFGGVVTRNMTTAIYTARRN